MSEARQDGRPAGTGGGKERRQHPRLTIPLNAEYILEGSAGPRPGRIRDLSAGGTALLATETGEPGGHLTSLRFLLPAEHGEPARLIDTPATVVRVVRGQPIPERLAAAAGRPGGDTGWLLGLQFEGIGQRDRERIQHFVYRRLMKEKMPATKSLGSRRIPFARPIAVRFERFDSFVEEVSSNLSETGMFITTRSPAQPGQVFELQFTLGEDFALIEGAAEVVWVRERAVGPDQPAGMGVRFVRLDDSSRAVIRRLVSAYRAAGEEPFDVEQAAGAPAGPPEPAAAPPVAGPPVAKAPDTEAPVTEPPRAEQVPPARPGGGVASGAGAAALAPPPEERGDLRRALDEALEARRQLEAKLAAVIGERDRLGGEAEGLRAALAKAEERVQASDAAVADARDQEERREQERLQELERLRHAEAELQARVEAAAAGAAELRGQLEAAVRSRAALEGRIDELERAVEARAGLEQQITELERAAAVEAERREEAERLRAAAESERLEAARRAEEHAGLGAELDRHREANADLTRGLEAADERAAQLQDELERAIERQSTLEAADERAAALQEELDRAIEERSALEEKTRRLDALLAAAATAPEPPPPEAAALRHQVETLERELADAQAIARQSREEGHRREQELLDRLEAAQPGPAAAEGPVVEHATADRRRGLRGAGLVAGGAALGALALLAVLRLDSAPGESPAIDLPRGAPLALELPSAEAPAAVAPDAPGAPVAAAVAPETPPGAAPGEAAQEATETAAASAPAPAAAEPAGPAAVEEAVRAWAAAWSEQRVEDYLASYSRQFVPPEGASRTEWEAGRRVRLERPAWIRLDLGPLATELTEPTRARVSFDQSYETPTFSDRVRKTLDLVWEEEAWKISGEQSE